MKQDFYDLMRATLEPRYADGATPWQQSGFSGPEERWVALRRPVADAIDRTGSFCDVGCANGYLAECVARWTAERGLSVELHGLDLSPRLVALARERLPLADFIVANARTHVPPRCYDFVRTELVYVPAADEAAYLTHLFDRSSRSPIGTRVSSSSDSGTTVRRCVGASSRNSWRPPPSRICRTACRRWRHRRSADDGSWRRHAGSYLMHRRAPRQLEGRPSIRR